MGNSVSITKIFQKNKALLAPMRGVNCPSFRVLCKKYGASILSTQVFWSWERPIWENRLESEFSDLDHPLIVQVGGNKPDELKETVNILDKYADIIDFNASCPHKKECGQKSGAFLLLHLNQLERAVNTVISSTQKPITVKIRTGWANDQINIDKTVKLLEDMGIAAIIIHARTRQQLFKGRADWAQVKIAKEMVNVPIIGNGDVDSGPKMEQMLKTTGCDAVMIGRAARGNPFIFQHINHWMREHKKIYQNFQQRKEDFLEFARLYHEIEKDRSLTELKDHALWFLKGFVNVNNLKKKIWLSEKTDEIIEAYSNFNSKSVYLAKKRK